MAPAFACLLAKRGFEVIGVDPAAASLNVARAKPGADRVRWVLGDATALPPLQLDMATMTGNVAQVFVTDQEWASTLRCTYAALRPGARLVFETRDPQQKAWLKWSREQSYRRIEIPEVGGVETWNEVAGVRGQLVTFRGTVVFAKDGTVLTSDSTLRFRERDEIADSLVTAGFSVEAVLDAPDRPGLEMVFVARREHSPRHQIRPRREGRGSAHRENQPLIAGHRKATVPNTRALRTDLRVPTAGPM